MMKKSFSFSLAARLPILIFVDQKALRIKLYCISSFTIPGWRKEIDAVLFIVALLIINIVPAAAAVIYYYYYRDHGLL